MPKAERLAAFALDPMFKMRSTLSSHLWIARYCKRALHLVPGLTAASAVRRAAATYPDASGMQPERAAELYARLSDIRENASTALRRRFDPDFDAGDASAGRELSRSAFALL